MTTTTKQTVVVDMKADVTFLLERQEDGTWKAVSGWFDTRSAENGLTMEWRVPGSEEIATYTEEMFEAVPGKGDIKL